MLVPQQIRALATVTPADSIDGMLLDHASSSHGEVVTAPHHKEGRAPSARRDRIDDIAATSESHRLAAPSLPE